MGVLCTVLSNSANSAVCLACKSGFTQDANDRTKGTHYLPSRQLREWCCMPPPARRRARAASSTGRRASSSARRAYQVHSSRTGSASTRVPLGRLSRRKTILAAHHATRPAPPAPVPVTSSSASPARTTGSPPQTANPCNPHLRQSAVPRPPPPLPTTSPPSSRTRQNPLSHLAHAVPLSAFMNPALHDYGCTITDITDIVEWPVLLYYRCEVLLGGYFRDTESKAHGTGTQQ
ncbi:hypothetical protein BDN71DRAFT_1594544 [Pleurotus eryngii]|uniref:Uncharacterized protein n=1 Tax=Pleurotus eryngii TaxID=5323 RepID=A0A9P5ZHN6_PLEER|nr:hypothetical protein BDN71DRAFT_1594544 [Pleurotus eryngii]